jgi:hypothetical protein
MDKDQARVYLQELIQDDPDDGLMPALKALGLWELIAAAVPRAKAVAVIDPAAWLEESSWTLRVGREMHWAHVKAAAREIEVKRILDAFESACRLYGEARHLDVRVTVTNDSLPEDCGYDVIDHVRGLSGFEVLTEYTPLDSSLELDEPEEDSDADGPDEDNSNSTTNDSGRA